MFVAGCKGEPATRVSEAALAPNAPRWQRATVLMTFEKGHGNYSTRIRYAINLSGTGGALYATLEQVFGPSGVQGPMEVTEQELDALKKKTPRALLAPDGHALVFSRDGGPRYQFVALDAGDKPVFCPHLTFAPDASGNPWAGAPTSRAWALAVLRTSANKGQVHYPSSDGAYSTAFQEEALGAIAYACAHREDAELRAAVATAAKQLPSFATSVVMDAATQCAAMLPPAR